MKERMRAAALIGVVMILTGSAVLAEDDRGRRTYEVTITNITKGQVFSPPVLVTHNRRIALFEVGAPAIDELALVAEDGMAQPLTDLANAQREVAEAIAGAGPIPPGAAAIYEINSRRNFPLLSVVTMMVNTNDAFIAINSERLPRSKNGTATYYALGYDAGSEANNEDCAFIPGPACAMGSGNMRATEDAEGYVHIHNGVHGIADLGPAPYDWRNPVARITIRRTR